MRWICAILIFILACEQLTKVVEKETVITKQNLYEFNVYSSGSVVQDTATLWFYGEFFPKDTLWDVLATASVFYSIDSSHSLSAEPVAIGSWLMRGKLIPGEMYLYHLNVQFYWPAGFTLFYRMGFSSGQHTQQSLGGHNETSDHSSHASFALPAFDGAGQGTEVRRQDLNR